MASLRRQKTSCLAPVALTAVPADDSKSLRAMVIHTDKSMARGFAIRAVPHTMWKAIRLPCVCPASYQGNSQLRGSYVSITFT